MGNFKHSTFEQRVKWLVKNSHLWIHGFMIDHYRYCGRVVVRDMKRDGLLAKSTWWRDCRLANEFEEAYKVWVKSL